MSSEICHQYPFVTVGGFVVASDGTILFVRSSKWNNLFTVPGGKVELGELREDAFRREFLEETALPVVNIRYATCCESIFSDEFHKKSHFVMHDYICDLAPGASKDDVVLNEEAQEYRWMTIEEALKEELTRETHVLLNWYKENR